jgi:hypothetical protein
MTKRQEWEQLIEIIAQTWARVPEEKLKYMLMPSDIAALGRWKARRLAEEVMREDPDIVFIDSRCCLEAA